MLLIPELLGDRESCESHAPTGARRLVHLAEHQRRSCDDAGAAHVGQELLALARSLADSSEYGDPFLVLGGAANQLHHQDGLADAGTPEHPGLTATDERRQEIDDLDAGLEHLALAALILEGWRCAVDGHSRDRRVDGRPSIGGVSENVQHPSEDRVSDRNGDGGSESAAPGLRDEARWSPPRRQREP